MNQLRQEKIKQKKEIRDQMAAMKRVDMVSHRSDRLNLHHLAGGCLHGLVRSRCYCDSRTRALCR